jgi:hypothetical protein
MAGPVERKKKKKINQHGDNFLATREKLEKKSPPKKEKQKGEFLCGHPSPSRKKGVTEKKGFSASGKEEVEAKQNAVHSIPGSNWSTRT